MDLTFSIQLDKFKIQSNNDVFDDMKSFSITSKLKLITYSLYNNSLYENDIEKILIKQKKDVTTDSVCHFYDGSKVENILFIETDYCQLVGCLNKDKLFKLQEQLLLDETKFKSELNLSITSTDLDETKKDNDYFKLKVSEFEIVTKRL